VLTDLSSNNIPKRGKVYQKTTKYTKRPRNIPQGHEIYQRAVKYTKWTQNRYTNTFQDPPKFSQTGIFGLKIYHLATRVCNDNRC
jgi:hypothetical protein